jgi:integrase
VVKAQTFADLHSQDTPAARSTFAVALAAFLADCATERNLAGTTLHAYRSNGERLGKRPWRGELTWADRLLDGFAAAELARVRKEMLDAGRSAKTINQYRVVVHAIFGDAPSSPARGWAWCDVKRMVSRGDLNFYAPDELARLVDSSLGDMDKAIYTVAAEAGARLSDVRGLRVRDLDFNPNGGCVRFARGYTSRGGDAPNKSREVRSVPMTDHMRQRLLAFCEGRPGDARVFEYEGHALDEGALHRRFKRTIKRAGLHDLRFHELRHTFGTQMIRKHDIRKVQGWMGHASITTTQIYLHFRDAPEDSATNSAVWDVAPQAPESTPPTTSNVVQMRPSKRRAGGTSGGPGVFGASPPLDGVA